MDNLRAMEQRYGIIIVAAAFVGKNATKDIATTS